MYPIQLWLTTRLIKNDINSLRFLPNDDFYNLSGWMIKPVARLVCSLFTLILVCLPLKAKQLRWAKKAAFAQYQKSSFWFGVSTAAASKYITFHRNLCDGVCMSCVAVGAQIFLGCQVVNMHIKTQIRSLLTPSGVYFFFMKRRVRLLSFPRSNAVSSLLNQYLTLIPFTNTTTLRLFPA